MGDAAEKGSARRGTGRSVVEITGNRTAVVDGCDGIVDYDDGQVTLRAGRLTVRFCGRNLRLQRLTENSAVIEGNLSCVEYRY